MFFPFTNLGEFLLLEEFPNFLEAYVFWAGFVVEELSYTFSLFGVNTTLGFCGVKIVNYRNSKVEMAVTSFEMQVELAVKPNLNIAVRRNVRVSVLNQITEGFTFRLIQS